MCKYCGGSEIPLARQETDHRDAEIYIRDNTLIADPRHDYLTAEIDFCPKCGEPLGEVKPLTKCCKNCAGTIINNNLGNPTCFIYKQCGTPDFYCSHFREPKGEAE